MGSGAAFRVRPNFLIYSQDGGGSNSSRNRLWKKSLQCLADELGMTLNVCHFPPGTSKWNKIEHRLFCFITKNWRGRPLTSYEVIVNLIASTKTHEKSGLIVPRRVGPTPVYETRIHSPATMNSNTSESREQNSTVNGTTRLKPRRRIAWSKLFVRLALR